MVGKAISLRKRFMVIIVVFVIAYVLLGLYTNKAAEVTVNNSRELSLELRQIGLSLSNISDTLHLLGVSLYQSTLYDNEDQPDNIQTRLGQLAQQVNQLLLLKAVKNNPEFYEPAVKLSENFRHITVFSQNLLEIQSDYERKYPAMPIMLGKLQPINNEMKGLIVTAIDEAKIESVTKPEQQQALDLFRDLRYIWSQMVGTVRIFVMNRMGAFGPPKSTMSRVLQDRDLYVEAIKELFSRLDVLDARHILNMVQSDALLQMKSQNNNYEFYFEKTKEIYLSDGWRTDRILLKEVADPAIENTWAQVYLLQNRLNAHTQLVINGFARTTDQLSGFIWLAVSLAVLLLVIGYVIFELLIRKPIAQIARALEAEGDGIEITPVLNYSVKETGILVNAFSKMQAQIRSRQLRLQTVLDNAGEGILTLNAHRQIQSVNIAAEKLFGYSGGELINKEIAIVIPAYLSLSQHSSFLQSPGADSRALILDEQEVMAQNKDGRVFPISLRLSQVMLDGETLFTALVSDISERKAMIDRLRHLAERDSLTGLYNRHFLMDELERIVDRLNRGDRQAIALLYIDLDNFKYVNDTLGHLSGDRVLQDVTKMLEKRARGTDLLTRLGGDEFAILLYDVDPLQAQSTAEAYRKQLADYVYRYDGQVVDIGCSIGVALIHDRIQRKEDILSRADLACHIAKRSGRNRVHIYESRDQENIDIMTADMGWSRRIKAAIENDTFVLASQPIVHTHTGKILFEEILLRLKENDSDLIMPSGFLPSAERFGLSLDLDRWVIKTSLTLMAENRVGNARGISINLCAKTVGDNQTLDLIESTIESLGLSADRILFEVTESIAISNLNLASEFLLKLKKLGCYTAIDDFGAGYSSFAYLKDLPVDFVKLDGSYIHQIHRDKIKRAIVVAMNDVAHALGKRTIAEFVESEDALLELKKIGIDYCQGFYTGKPELIAPKPGNIVYLRK